MFRFISKFFEKRRTLALRRSRVLLAQGSRIDPGTRFVNGFGEGCFLELGAGARIDRNVEVDISSASVRIGSGTFIHSGASIYGDVIFGDHCLISKNLYASSGGHSIALPCYIRHCDSIAPSVPRSLPIRVHDDVWIGYNVFIKPGITIGKGAVAGALSVITKNVPPYTVVGGSAAKMIKNRLPFVPPPVLLSYQKEHLPYFYSGFGQSGMESCGDGYLVVKETICLSVPNDFLGGEIVVIGNTLVQNGLSLSPSGVGDTFPPGSFQLRLFAPAEAVITQFGYLKFIFFRVDSVDAGTRIVEVRYGR